MEKCQGRVWTGFRYTSCGAKVKVERDGEHYCGRHDPVRLEEKRAERTKAMNAEEAARQRWLKEKAELNAEMQRRYDCHDALVEALKSVLSHVENENIPRIAAQCTLCHTYREVIRSALALAGETP